jgi:hypothetical protein
METGELLVICSSCCIFLSIVVMALAILFKKDVCAKLKVPLLCTSSSSSASTSLPTSWTAANATYYESFATCCQGTPVYDPKAPKDECTKYNACTYLGQFTGLDGKLTYEQVKARNIASVFHAPTQKNQKRDMAWWKSTIKGRRIEVRYGKKTMILDALDTCGEWDCDRCCSKNAHQTTGWLLDLEIHTAKRFWGGKPKNAKVEFRFL